MALIILGICLFFGFLFLFLLLMPRPSAAGALLEQATRTTRAAEDVPVWRSALNVDYLAKPFTLLRGLFSPEPDPDLVHRLALAGYRKPAHADVFLGVRLAVPAILGVLVALFVPSATILFFLMAVVLGFFIPDFWLSQRDHAAAAKNQAQSSRWFGFSGHLPGSGLGIGPGNYSDGPRVAREPSRTERRVRANQS